MSEILLEKYQVIIPSIISIVSSIITIFIGIIALFGEQIKAKLEAKRIIKIEKCKAAGNSEYTFEYPKYNRYEAYEEQVVKYILESGYFSRHINRRHILTNEFLPSTFKFTTKGVNEHRKKVMRIFQGILKSKVKNNYEL